MSPRRSRREIVSWPTPRAAAIASLAEPETLSEPAAKAFSSAAENRSG